MKKIIATVLIISVCALMPLIPGRTMAATAPATVITTPEDDAIIKPCPGGTYRVQKHTKKGKKIINALIAGGIGAALGGGIGGGRGALIGLGSGAGGYLVYRYVKDKRGRCVPRYVRG